MPLLPSTALRTLPCVVFVVISWIALYAPAFAEPRKVGVIYPGPHPLVDDVLAGLRSGFVAKNLKEGEDYVFIEKHAAGDPANFSSVCQAVIASGADVLVPIATPTTQALVKENGGRLPVVFIAVTDPVGAGILDDMNVPGNNLTGVSDAWPYRAQLELLKAICPEVRTIGVMYNPAEENSVYGIKQIREIVRSLDLVVVDGTVTGPAEISSRASNLITVNKVDALFLSSDNTILGAAEPAIKAGQEHRIPVFSGDSGTVERGALASASIGYVGVGEEAAKLLVRVFGGEPPGQIPVHVAEGSDIHINLDAARAVGATIPEDVRARATKVHGTDAPQETNGQVFLPVLGAVAVCVIAFAVLVLVRRRFLGQAR